jgi:hypothetical protein
VLFAPDYFRGFGTFGVNPFPNPLECYIGAWDWGKYLGDEAIEQGVDVRVFMESLIAEFDARDGEIRRELYELAAYQDGSLDEWLRRRYRAR